MSRSLILFTGSLLILTGPAWGGSPIVDNINANFSPGFFTFGPDNVGWVYEPTFDYELDGIFSTFRPIGNPLPATRDVTLTLYDAPPSSGGTPLRSGAFSAGPAGGDLGVMFAPLDVTAGEDYFIGYESIAGLGLNIVDFAVSLPAPDFMQNPAVQFQSGWYTGANFSTFNSVADSPGFAAPILRFLGATDLKPDPRPPSVEALTITDGNASITVDPLTDNGLISWDTDGVSNMYEQSWYHRIGDATQESHLDSLPLMVAETVGTNQIHLVYRGSELEADLLYTLTGGDADSGTSTIEETVTLTNLDTANSLPVVWFEYDDVDIPVFDSNTASGGVDGVTQVGAGTMVSVTSQSPTPDAFQISQAFNVQTLRDSLRDAAITNLSNGTSPFGPTDIDFAFQWNFDIPANGSVSISTLKVTAVPEPAALLLVCMGTVGVWVACRRRK